MFDPIDEGRGEITGWVHDQCEEGGVRQVIVEALVGILACVFFCGLVYVSIIGIPASAKAVRVLGEHGYSHIRIHRAMRWSCSDSDTFVDGFDAVSPSGHPVSGVVCSGWFKSSTIRID